MGKLENFLGHGYTVIKFALRLTFKWAWDAQLQATVENKMHSTDLTKREIVRM